MSFEIGDNKLKELWVESNKVKEVWVGDNKVWSSSVELWLGQYGYSTKDLLSVKSESDLTQNIPYGYGNKGWYYFDGYFYCFTNNDTVSGVEQYTIYFRRTRDGVNYEDIMTFSVYGNDPTTIPMYYLNGYLIFIHATSAAAIGYTLKVEYSKDGLNWSQEIVLSSDYYGSHYGMKHISMCYFKGAYYIAYSRDYISNSSRRTILKVSKTTLDAPCRFLDWFSYGDGSCFGAAIFCDENNMYFAGKADKFVDVLKFSDPNTTTAVTLLKRFESGNYADGDGYFQCCCLANIIGDYAYCQMIQHGNNSNFGYYFTVKMTTGEVSDRFEDSSVIYKTNMARKDGYYYYVYSRTLYRITPDGSSTTAIATSANYTDLERFNKHMTYGELNTIGC